MLGYQTHLDLADPEDAVGVNARGCMRLRLDNHTSQRNLRSVKNIRAWLDM